MRRELSSEREQHVQWLSLLSGSEKLTWLSCRVGREEARINHKDPNCSMEELGFLLRAEGSI